MIRLTGEYTHKLDDKGRVSLPSKIRSQIGEAVIITKGLDGCAYVYSEQSWNDIAEKLSSLSLGNASARAFNRFILSSALEVGIDSSGRVLLPEAIRNYIDTDSEVVIAGVGNRLELWEPAKWQEQISTVSAEIDTLAEGLGEIGMI